MLKCHTLILALFLPISVSAQKRIEKSFDAFSINTVTINGDGIFKITIETSSTSTIKIIATIEGETFDNLLITEKQALSSITFGLDYAPFFKPDNDKLAAHKVVAVELFMLIPENKIVNVHSDLASFEGTGFFKSLNVSLSQGNCKLHNFKGNGIFHTLKGDIIIQAHPEVTGVAISEYGTVSNSLRIHQKYDIAAQSKHGNIDLTQIKY